MSYYTQGIFRTLGVFGQCMLELASYMGPAAQQQHPLLVLVDVVGSVAVALHGTPEILQKLYGHILRTGAFVVMKE